MNPLKALHEHKQSPWLDYIRRSLITSGELQRLIDEDGLMGVTSNPAIFEKAITGSNDYTDALAALEPENLDAMALYERLAIKDIQDSTDVMRSVYDKTNKRDGYVSLEVSPYLAKDTQGTIDEARRLWKAVDRPNLMVKVPATPEGVPAIQTLISEGININVTLLFAQSAYEEVAEAYISGLETFVANGGDPSHVASVASFFISRIDSMIDSQLAAKAKADPANAALINSLQGKVAIANAKLTYQAYKDIYRSARWKALEEKGAQTQRLLWASTSTKNPSYRDVLYVEELIGAETVNTIPPATFDAFRDHGKLRGSLEEDLDGAHDIMDTLAKVGVSMKDATDNLLSEAVRLFAEPFEKLLRSVDKKCKLVSWTKINKQSLQLTAEQDGQFKAALEDWQVGGKVRRLWYRDAKLWTGTDESQWLGWLGITEDQLNNSDHLRKVAEDVKAAGFETAMVLGMGGSSLCPEVLKMTFGKIEGAPELHVLDSTDPAQVATFAGKIDPAKTVFIVSSKSGSTLEPNIFKQYFFELTKQAVGDQAGSHFIAVTDPGSKVQQIATSEGFRHIFPGVPSIGGRYSALSNFGMIPAAVMGIDAVEFLDQADEMVNACSYCVPTGDNPGVVLGCVLGSMANAGRDKLTIVASPDIWDLGAWLEQLLAESTGKEGKGIIPVDRENLGAPAAYGNDRVFAYMRSAKGADAAQDAAVEALAAAGHPVVRIDVSDAMTLGQEFFRWEIATAVAGSIIGINSFNQPDVEASKLATRKLTSEYEKTGSLPAETPILEDGGVKLFTDEANAAALKAAAGDDQTLGGYLKAHLNRLGAGDYFAVLGYVEMNDAHDVHLQGLRHAVRDAKQVATCLGYGPRFLHSTGQAYKGGPNSGVFLQITCDDANDLPVPGQTYTFGVVKAAQARGDFEVLAERNRRALRVHLGADVKAGLATLQAEIEKALSSQSADSNQGEAEVMSEAQAKIGMIGLAVMGRNLAMNIERNGFPVAVWNRNPETVDEFMKEVEGKKFIGCHTAEEFVKAIERPRKIILLVKAGAPVDWTIDQIKPYLEEGDIIIDGGNSYFPDTIRREKALKAEGLNFIGCGVSGGEEGALWGPSLMPGGDPDAYKNLAPIWEAIAAKVDDGPCVTYIGPDGAGHFVKMAHNGIEYGDMQLIAEAYDVLRRVLGMEAAELAEVFDKWNQGSLQSFLIEITAQIFKAVDPDTGKALVDLVMDKAGQKGTGKWTSMEALDMGIAVPTIHASIESRILSGLKAEREEAAREIPGPDYKYEGDRQEFIDAVHDALYASKICSYAQGMAMLAQASRDRNWNLNLGEISRIWKGGCIIRAQFLDKIKQAYHRRPDLPNLLLDPDFKAWVIDAQPRWRQVVSVAAQAGIGIPAMAGSLAYFDTYRTANLPLNLTQAQRDFFGSHTYERVDKPELGFVHTEWKELIK